MACVPKNTGNPACSFVSEAAASLIFVPRYDSSGVENKIAAADVVNSAYITAKINNADTLARWYPYPVSRVFNFDATTSDNSFKTFTDDRKELTKTGVKSVKFEIASATIVDEQFFKTCKCQEWCVFVIDVSGNLLGYKKSIDDLDLYPKVISRNSISPKLMDAKIGSNSRTLEVSFDWDKSMEWEFAIPYDDLGFNITPLLIGLIDVYLEKASYSHTTTTVTFKLITDRAKRGGVNSAYTQFLVASDFKDSAGANPSTVTNVTASTKPSITGLAFDTATGIYVLTFAASSFATNDKVKLYPVKTGFDFTNVSAISI